MKVGIFDAIAFSGLFLAASCSRLFAFNKVRLSFANARLRCQRDHTDLAVVRNAEDNVKLNEALGGTQNVWIGLTADTESWRWSEAEGQTGVEFTNWKSGAPSAALYKSCTVVNTDGTWSDEDCLKINRFMCEKDIGQARITRFVPGPGISDWIHAQNYCRTTYRDLAVVKTPNENAEITSMIQSEPFWIGLFRDSWKWADDSPLTFENWDDNFPNTDINACAAVSHDGKWINQNCNETRPYACYSDESGKQVNVVKLVLKKTDPAVGLEELDILQQLNQTLLKHGLTDVTLKWRKQPDGKIFHKTKEKEKQSSAKKDDCDFV